MYNKLCFIHGTDFSLKNLGADLKNWPVVQLTSETKQCPVSAEFFHVYIQIGLPLAREKKMTYFFMFQVRIDERINDNAKTRVTSSAHPRDVSVSIKLGSNLSAV